jgi:hypothetical protein
MKIWFDTEFIEDGRTIDLISIGLVREDGVGLYMENGECDLSRADDWVKENVISKLDGAKVSRAAMREAILKFVNQPREDYPAWSGGIHGPGPPEFWSYYADYDWVVLCQLFGRMIDLPPGWPMYCIDFKQWLKEHGDPELRKLPEDRAHNALADAVWLRDEWMRLHG